MKRAIFLLLLFIFPLSVFPLQAEKQALPIDTAFHFSLKTDTTDQKKIAADWRIAQEHYLYKQRIHITLVSLEKQEEVINLIFPKSEILIDPVLGDSEVYKETLHLSFSIPLDEKERSLQVEYQGCAAWGLCYPPQTKIFTITDSNGQRSIQPHPTLRALDASPTLATPLEQDTFSALFQGKHLALTAGGFYLLGLLLAFTPCVLPMLPILGAVIMSEKNLTSRRGFLLSLVYVLSMSITYAFAGLLAASLGQTVQSVFQHPWVIVSFSGLFVVLALMQLEKLHFRLPQMIADRLHALNQAQQGGHVVGALLMGVLSTLIASPCVSAPLIGTLSYIAQTGDKTLGALCLWMLGLGMGTPLLLFGALGGRYMPKAGHWMKRVNQLFAIMLLGLAIWFLERVFSGTVILALWGCLALFAGYLMGAFHRQAPGYIPRLGALVAIYGVVLWVGALSHQTHPLYPFIEKTIPNHHATTPSTLVHTMSELNLALKEAKTNQKPVLLDFYADWCASCQHIERDIFQDADIPTLLEPWHVIRVDITKPGHETNALMRKWNVLAPPALIFLDAQGTEISRGRIVGELNKYRFIEHLMRLSPSKKP